MDRKVDEALVRRSRAERDAEYRQLSGELRAAPAGVDGAARLARARRRLEEIAGIDFFAAPGRGSTEAVIERMQKRLERRGRSMKTEKKARTKDLVGHTWVTRRGIKVDRRKIHLDDPIRHTGTYMVVVEVTDEVTATIKTIVSAA